MVGFNRLLTGAFLVVPEDGVVILGPLDWPMEVTTEQISSKTGIMSSISLRFITFDI